MTSLVRVNGTTQPTELFGRDIKFVLCAATGIHTTYTTADSNFAKAVRVLEKFCTVSVIGIPASDNVRFIVEGLPTGNVLTAAGALVDIAAALKADCDIANGLTSTWTINDSMSGTTFA